MALNKEQLKQDIVGILNDMLTREVYSVDEFSDRLSEAIDKFVKTGNAVGGDSHGDSHELTIE